MSDEYINKEEAIQSIIAHDLVGGDARGWAEYLLENASTVDVEPVRHGRWIEQGLSPYEGTRRCSICESSYDIKEQFNYCPNCGARMDNER